MIKYSKSKKYVLRSSKGKPKRWHRKLPKNSKLTDPRNKKSINQDKQLRADKVYPNTEWGRRRWKLERSNSDLIGYDTLVKRVKVIQKKYKSSIQFKEKKKYVTLRKRTGLTGVEEHNLILFVKKNVSDIQHIDMDELIDSDLSYDENKEILKRAVSPTFSEARGDYY